MHKGLWLGNSERLELQPLAHQVLPRDVILLSFLPRQQVLGQGPSWHLLTSFPSFWDFLAKAGRAVSSCNIGGEPQDHTQVSRSLEGHRIRGSC